jgi:hypothetical protein
LLGVLLTAPLRRKEYSRETKPTLSWTVRQPMTSHFARLIYQEPSRFFESSPHWQCCPVRFFSRSKEQNALTKFISHMKHEYLRFLVTKLRESVKLHHVRTSAWHNSAPTEIIFMKFGIWVFSRQSVYKIKVSLTCDKNNMYFTWRYMIILGTAVAQWLRYCAKNEKVTGSIPDAVMEFSLT